MWHVSAFGIREAPRWSLYGQISNWDVVLCGQHNNMPTTCSVLMTNPVFSLRFCLFSHSLISSTASHLVSTALTRHMGEVTLSSRDVAETCVRCCETSCFPKLNQEFIILLCKPNEVLFWLHLNKSLWSLGISRAWRRQRSDLTRGRRFKSHVRWSTTCSWSVDFLGCS